MDQTVKAIWSREHTNRSSSLERAREAAELTIPSLMPPEGHNEHSSLPQPYQSLGARGVNNLASKLMLALLPAGNPFFRLNVEKGVSQQVERLNELQALLRDVENNAVKEVENSNLRAMAHSALKQLIVSGSAILHLPDKGRNQLFRLNQFVIMRDGDGTWRRMIIKESVHPQTLDEATREKAQVKSEDEDKEQVDLYTMVERVGDKAEWYQELNEIKLEDTFGRSSVDDCPYIPLRWVEVENEDYGRGHVEEYLGDMRSLDGLSRDIIDFSAAAAKVVFLERTGSMTDVEAVNKARSGEMVSGNIDDIGVLQLDKFHDFKVIKEVINDLTLRLSHAFLLSTGTVRDAERVTAEEIRMQAQELEDVLGGVYTVLAQEFQLPIVRRLLARLRVAGKYPKNLPKGALKPVIVTGFDALGRGHELNKFRAFMSDGVSMFGERFMEEFGLTRSADFLAIHHNVDIEQLKKTTEEKEQDALQRTQDTLIEKGAGPAVSAAASAVTNNQ